MLGTSKSQTLLVPHDFHWSSNRTRDTWGLLLEPFLCVVKACVVFDFFTLDSRCPLLVKVLRGMGHRDKDVFKCLHGRG